MLTDDPFWKRVLSWYRRGVTLLLAILALLYCGGLLLNMEVGALDRYRDPLILASLVMIVELLTRLTRMTSESTQAKVTFYGDHTAFYRATRHAVENARKRVYVSYLSAHPPDRLGEATRSHVAACRKWAERSPSHHFRRVLFECDTPQMRRFLDDELEAQRRIKKKGHNYNVSVVPKNHHTSDSNVGLYDDQVFVCYSASPDRLIGYSIHSPELASGYYEHYYEKLWGSARPLTEPADIPAAAENP